MRTLHKLINTNSSILGMKVTTTVSYDHNYKATVSLPIEYNQKLKSHIDFGKGTPRKPNVGLQIEGTYRLREGDTKEPQYWFARIHKKLDEKHWRSWDVTGC